jgi:periplasmic protein TonB
MIALAPEDRADLIRWLVSGAIILFAHGAIAASVLRQLPPEDENVHGATVVMIELQPVVAETPKEQPEEKVEEKEEKIDPPSDVAMLPEPKQEVPKPVEEEPPPPPPPVTVAPVEGRQDASGSNPLPAWQKEINKILEKNKRYPSQARAQRKRMVTRVAFNMDRQGKVMSAHIVASSGSSAFDQEALELIQRAQPYPPPPAVLPGAEIPIVVPIWFDPPR